MVIKIIVGILFLIIITLNYGQTENQLKFSVDAAEQFKTFITSSPQIGNLNSFYHSKNTYSDIYLDTPDSLIFKNNLSLRIRKRVFDDSISTTTFSLQLKSEMNEFNSIRMEVEEPELDFYHLNIDGQKTPIIELIETVFNHFEQTPFQPQSEPTKNAIFYLEKWIQMKANAPIAPFQKLRSLPFVGSKAISNLRLFTCGSSTRYRSHIYAPHTTTLQLGISNNKIKRDKTPSFFIKNTSANWLLETSLDIAHFYAINHQPTQEITIIEYEVEQKHHDTSLSPLIFKTFQSEMKTLFDLKPKFNSKYRQMLLFFSAQ